MPAGLTPVFWIALATGAVALVTAFVVALDDLGEALQERDWTRSGVFWLAALAAFLLVLLVLAQIGVVTLP